MRKKVIIALLCLLAGTAGCADGKVVDESRPGGMETVLEQEAEEQQSVGSPQAEDIQEESLQPDRNPIREEDALTETGAWKTDGEAADGEQTPPSEPFVDKLTQEGLGWGLSFGKSGAQPVGNASVEELKQYDAYYMGDESEKVIYLTFDCGYENGNTEAILDALKKHDAPATFFVVGHYLEEEPELVKRMADEGHAVGSHTYHHPDINTLPDKEAFQEEMDSLRELYSQVMGGELAMYYRPPEGKCGITNLKMAQELGYVTIFWSLAYVDWDVEKQPSHEDALAKLTTRIHPGAVVLLHNTSKTNGEILDELLTEWENMGYCFKPLSALTG